MVLVHVYIGIDPQDSTDYDLNLDASATYQSIIDLFLSEGGQSGQIYNLEDEVVDYDAPINLLEVNYIITPGDYNTVFVRNLEGQSVRVTYPENGIVRDIYNYSHSLGFGRNVRLVLKEEDAPIDVGIPVVFLIKSPNKAERETEARVEIKGGAEVEVKPTLLRGKYFPLDTPVVDLELTPDKTIYLIKYHVLFKCERS